MKSTTDHQQNETFAERLTLRLTKYSLASTPILMVVLPKWIDPKNKIDFEQLVKNEWHLCLTMIFPLFSEDILLLLQLIIETISLFNFFKPLPCFMLSTREMVMCFAQKMSESPWRVKYSNHPPMRVIPMDNFSTRYTKCYHFLPEETYTFTDGVHTLKVKAVQQGVYTDKTAYNTGVKFEREESSGIELHISTKHLTMSQLMNLINEKQPQPLTIFSVGSASMGTFHGQKRAWSAQAPLPELSIDSCILTEQNKMLLTRHLKQFLDPEYANMLHERQMMCKSCILLTGPPGTAKTTLAMAIARHCGRDLYMGKGEILKRDIDGLPWSRATFLLDDADFLQLQNRQIITEKTEQNNTTTSEKKGNESLYMMMQLLDAYILGSGVQIILCTNYPDQLHTAMLRSGRIDLHLEMGPLTEECMFQQIWQNVFHSQLILKNKRQWKDLLEGKLTTGDVSLLCKKHMDNAFKARSELMRLVTDKNIITITESSSSLLLPPPSSSSLLLPPSSSSSLLLPPPPSTNASVGTSTSV